MKKIFLFLFIFTTACAPQVTATRFAEVTVTVPPATSTSTPIPISPTPDQPADTGPSPEQIAAKIAEINTEFRGFYEVNEDGQFYAIDQTTGETTFHPEFGIHLGTGDLTWTHYSELLGRELTEPVADLRMDYTMDANNKMVYTGAFSIQGCNFDGKQCNPDMVLDPVTGKEVAQKHSIFEVMMLQLEDMKRMSEQDKKDAFDFSQDHFDKLLNPNHGSRSIRFVDGRGIEHTWLLYFPAGEGRYAQDWSNQMIVRDRGILRGVPYFIFAGIDRGATGFAVWEVGAGTDNLVRREIFIDQRSITNFNIYNENQWTFMVDEEWLPEEYELLPFD